uniref:Uncharacterized protein n=1 Tax=Zea mays TaxID=4577 RepID=C4JAM0_MAIZE|nr:unknown [Zea mays]|eukprot:NP_001183749.1 uncharacterized protein LOC100502342 [Zea mays]
MPGCPTSSASPSSTAPTQPSCGSWYRSRPASAPSASASGRLSIHSISIVFYAIYCIAMGQWMIRICFLRLAHDLSSYTISLIDCSLHLLIYMFTCFNFCQHP